MKSNPQLPKPSLEAKQHSHTLSQHIRSSLANRESMPFSEFMQHALYTPNLGYYANGLPKIGREGDFITAPEISPIFSNCLANQAAQVLQTLTHPNIIEFGAGRGTMARDILQALSTQLDLENYYIIELSASLKAQQQATLKSLPEELYQKVIWLNELPNEPMEAVVLANEVLDAMPFERFQLEGQQAQMMNVHYDQTSGHFDWTLTPITNPQVQALADQLIQNIGFPEKGTYQTEINLNIQPWLSAIAQFLSKGMVLLVDYGYSRAEYYQPARMMGTLRCHYQHLAHSNPFFYPGLQDITAHVDFTAVAESALETGFKVAGFTTQAHFLMGTGLLEMSASVESEMTEQIKIAQQIKTLTLPNEMGETFKVIALTQDFDEPLMGFMMRDLTHQL